MRTRNFPQIPSQSAEILARFRQQMADYARGELLRALREERHLTQAQAAHLLGTSEKSIRSWEQGNPIRWENVLKLAEFYKRDPNELVDREGLIDDVAPPGRIEGKLDKALEMLETIQALQIADASSRGKTPAGRRSPPSRASKAKKRAAS